MSSSETGTGAGTATPTAGSTRQVPVKELDHVVVRFAGDSGDGMQLAGTQLTNTSAAVGNDISTLPDFPAEIRAPAGSLAGVSGFQLNFSERMVHTPGDGCDVLVAMNPAALKTNIADLAEGGTVIVNVDAFTKNNLQKAGCDENPLEDGSLSKYAVYKVQIEKLITEATKDTGLGNKAILRTKNFFALGLVYWLYDRPLDTTEGWISTKFAKVPAVAEANLRALRAGFYYGETTEAFQTRYRVNRAVIPPGRYCKLTGNEAVAMGMITAAKLAKKTLFYGSYPITPASDILHELSKHANYDVKTFQAEDEIAAVTSALGAAFAGEFASTGTSGPGVALKGEALGLAVMTELPMVIVNVQRGGPSTGLPTKTEQADLMQAVYGRNGECPIPVIAAATPGDCFWMAIEAFRIAAKYMTPVMFLTDGYLANGAEPWRLPEMSELPDLTVNHPQANGKEFLPYDRDEVNARPWAVPGTKGLEHRIGGLEKANLTGNVSYDPENHESMVRLRAAKVDGIAKDVPPVEIHGDVDADLLVLGWGSTYGAIVSAVDQVRETGKKVASAHIKYLHPFPSNLGDVLRSFKRVVIPEMNMGQLLVMIRSRYLIDAIGFNKIQGKPFRIQEVVDKIEELLEG